LYKVQKGKQEQYVKDEGELQEHFLQLALDGAELYVNPEAPPLKGESLEQLVRGYREVVARLESLGRVYPLQVTRLFLEMPTLSVADLSDEATVQTWIDLLKERFVTDDVGVEFEATLQFDQEHHVYLPSVRRTSRGVTDDFLLSQDFFRSADYRLVTEMSGQLAGLLEEGAFVQRGERSKPVQDFESALDWLVAEARRGVDIQRYKGLGEMNPDQLWKTTMDPEVRRMLLVTVDDAVGADQMFTTLMGDQVEPRRDFIESNALSVVNLDV
jgi:DNA gyrase subunit B